MQHPTLQNVRIRSTRDALQVFHGVATHRLPLITRRLDAEERRNIVPGNVYVWEERGANTEPTGLGMERWTDGMGWGPSRVRDEFLFYHQKDSDVTDDLVNPVTPWAQMMRRPAARPNTRPFSVDVRPVPESERLIKQTYSVHVSLPADRPKGIIRKWHLTAYFSPHRLDELDTIDNLRGVGDVVVPEGWFRSARIGRNRRDSRTPRTSPNLRGPQPFAYIVSLKFLSSIGFSPPISITFSALILGISIRLFDSCVSASLCGACSASAGASGGPRSDGWAEA
ncbi:hypothetical protein NLJ89_g207 [Agrocybe chaxingu]|uniref:Uncharacterized protein n=1 Tax=Agrocybe chaxingu TaxID=84603 RepID=A0A9W8N2G8_9AGAR|nr:hypothetical protein NLJ89_g207 [Agrocybe chaxingu]